MIESHTNTYTDTHKCKDWQGPPACDDCVPCHLVANLDIVSSQDTI